MRTAIFLLGLALAVVGFALSSVPVILIAGGTLGIAIMRGK